MGTGMEKQLTQPRDLAMGGGSSTLTQSPGTGTGEATRTATNEKPVLGLGKIKGGEGITGQRRAETLQEN